jgi:beta-glucosidase
MLMKKMQSSMTADEKCVRTVDLNYKRILKHSPMKTIGTLYTSKEFFLKILTVLLISVGLGSIYAFSDDSSVNDDPIKSYQDRTDDLIKKMTVEEKVGQMLCVWQTRDSLLLGDDGKVDFDKAKENFPDGIGQIGRPSDSRGGLSPYETVEYVNEIQRYFIEETRLGIPVFFHEEALHGHAAKEATSFPQPIAMASTFDPELINRVFSLAAEEARVRGAHQVLTPVVDVSREPRWGRVEETYGEDPYLSAEIGMAAVKGFQGDATFDDKKHVIATLKHMAGHGQPSGGMNISPANLSERTIREVFLYPFKRIVEEANVMSIMASYNEVNGVPSHANKWMFQDVLRGEWGFEGYVVSDYYALRELNIRE